LGLSLKKPSSVREYTHWYSGDPAIDSEHDAFDWDRFLESGDTEFCPLKPKQMPTEFRLRHLTGREHADLVDIMQARGVAAAACESFRICCVQVGDFYRSRGSAVPDEVFDAVYFYPEQPGPGSIVAEVGMRAMAEASLKKQ